MTDKGRHLTLIVFLSILPKLTDTLHLKLEVHKEYNVIAKFHVHSAPMFCVWSVRLISMYTLHLKVVSNTNIKKQRITGLNVFLPQGDIVSKILKYIFIRSHESFKWPIAIRFR